MVNNVIILLHAVSDTDNATSPLAIMEKMLDELPPGEQAMSMMPQPKNGVWMNPNPVMMVQEFLHQTVFLKKGRKLMLFVCILPNS